MRKTRDEEKGQPSTIRFGKEGARLERMAKREGKSWGEIVRQALIDRELSQSMFKDTARDAVLALFAVLLPDERFDPVEDERQEKAIQYLGALLNSMSAAEGIAAAFTLLFAENMLEMSAIRIPLVGESDSIEGEPHEEQ